MTQPPRRRCPSGEPIFILGRRAASRTLAWRIPQGESPGFSRPGEIGLAEDDLASPAALLLHHFLSTGDVGRHGRDVRTARLPFCCSSSRLGDVGAGYFAAKN